MRVLLFLLLLSISLPCNARADMDMQKEAQIISNLLKYIHGVSVANIGVVYDPADGSSKREADFLVKSLSENEGRKLTPINVDTIGQNQDVKFIIVTNGLASHFNTIAAQAKRQRIFTLSLDTRCTQQNCCVLSIDTSTGIEIYLNEGLLRDFGFDVDAALRFMVKRV